MVNVTDVWSDPADPGWGVFVQQQGPIAFAALFIHDADGQPRGWSCHAPPAQPDGSFMGDLYRTVGPATAQGATATLVGSLRFAPATSQTRTFPTPSTA